VVGDRGGRLVTVPLAGAAVAKHGGEAYFSRTADT
jgi:hypothetical protein